MSNLNHTDKKIGCPECGTDIRPGMVTCRQCGARLHEPGTENASTGSPCDETPPHIHATFCQNCGEALRPGMLRCRNCGNLPLGETPPTSSVKLSASASWAADLFDSVPLKAPPQAPHPTIGDDERLLESFMKEAPAVPRPTIGDDERLLESLMKETPPSPHPTIGDEERLLAALMKETPDALHPTMPSVNAQTKDKRAKREQLSAAKTTAAKSAPVSQPPPRLCPDCQRPLADHSTICAWCAEVQAACQVAYQQAKAKIAESMVAQAKATFKAAEDRAKAEIAWAFAPNVDRYWWGWMGGIEFGPVEFMQVFALAKNGQLKPSDLIRNGSYGQFFPSSSTPGLLNAVAIVSKASEVLALAEAQAQAAAASVPPPTKAQLIAASKEAASVAHEQLARATEAVTAAPHVASAPVHATPSPGGAEVTVPEPTMPVRNAPSPAPTTTADAPEMMPTPREYSSAPTVARPHYPRPQPTRQSWDPAKTALFKKIMVGSLACVLVAGGFGLKHAFRKVHRTVVRSAPVGNSVASINSNKRPSAK